MKLQKSSVEQLPRLARLVGTTYRNAPCPCGRSSSNSRTSRCGMLGTIRSLAYQALPLGCLHLPPFFIPPQVRSKPYLMLAGIFSLPLCRYLRWFGTPPGMPRVPMYTINAPYRKLARFLRFRVGCHLLPCVIGRHDSISRHRRLCPKCSHPCALRDELYLIFEYPSIQPFRQTYHRLFTGPTSMRQKVFWQADLRGVVLFVCAALDTVLS